MSDDHHFWHEPVQDPDLEIREGGGGGGSPKKFFRSKNKGRGEPAGPLPWIRHCKLFKYCVKENVRRWNLGEWSRAGALLLLLNDLESSIFASYAGNPGF